jgi:signal peptidase I
VRRRLGHLRTFVLWAVVGVTAFALAYVAAGYVLGWRGLTVMSGSMEPTLHVGDVVIAHSTRADHAQPGQVITFADPDRRRKLLTHRVKTVSLVDGQARFVTQGDANTGTEQWTIPADGKIGVVDQRIPKVGYVAVYARSRPGMLALLIPVIVISFLELLALWRPPKKVVPELPPRPAGEHT